MPLEIERKFRVRMDPQAWPDLVCVPLAAWEIWQGYVTLPASDPEVRVRKLRRLEPESVTEIPPRVLRDEQGGETVLCTLAIKAQVPTSTSGALSRREVEPPIDEPHFSEIWKLCEGRRLHKIRVDYMAALPSGHRVLTVDTFEGNLEGLILAEIEFGDWPSSAAFEPPSFLGSEVTHDERYRNAALAAATGPPPE